MYVLDYNRWWFLVDKDLKADIEFVQKQKDELLKSHANKFLLIHKQKVVGSFDDYTHAASEGVRQYGTDGIFLVYQLTAKPPVNFIMEAALWLIRFAMVDKQNEKIKMEKKK